VAGFAVPRTRFAHEVVLAAKAAQGLVPGETREARAAVATTHLRTWVACEKRATEGLRYSLDAIVAYTKFTDERGGCLHLRGAAAMKKEYGARAYGAVLGTPVVRGGPVGASPQTSPVDALEYCLAALPGDALADCLALRTFARHLARTHHLVKSVAQPLLMDFLAIRWLLVGDERALMRYSFHPEIARVVVHPSILLETEPRALLRKIRFRWPQARVGWYAASNSPIAFACRAALGP
jgi:hypothetical protein